nr:integrase, catalytic region, zinc finger, CCHC-type, peptidase aspartic, catalytic [Tanacetum cinerariifolium]
MNMGQDRQMQMVRGNGENQFRQYAGQNVGNLNGYNAIQNVMNQVAHNPRVQNVRNQNGLIGVPENANLNGNGNLVAARAEGNAARHNGNQIRCYNYSGVGHFARNCPQASTLGTQSDKAPVYDSDGSAEYTELLEPIPEPHQVPQNDNIVFSEVTSVEQSGEIVEQHPANFEETHRQMQMIGGNGGNQFRQYAGQNAGNLNGYNAVQNVGNQGNAARQNGNQIRCYNCRGIGHYARNCTARPRRRDAAYLQTQLLIAQKDEAGIQLQAEEYDLMAAAADLDEIEEVNANCILMANLQQASSLGTQTNSAPFYDSDGSAEVHENYDNNEIFNMFTHEEQYTELLEPIPESHQVPQNDNEVISEVTSVEQGGETVEQHSAKFEETRALYESLYQNLAVEVKKVNSKLENGNVELEFQVLNYARENAHLKATYKNLFDTISVSHTQTKTIIASLQKQLHNSIYENAKLRAQLFNKISDQKDNKRGTRENTKFAKQSIVENLPKVDNTKTRRPQPRSNTKNDRVPSASKNSRSKNKDDEVEEHHRNLMLSKNTKHMSSACNNITLDSQNVISKVVCAMCKQCLISVNHDVIQICLWCVDSGCFKHMIGNLNLLINFVWKFMGTIHFKNDHVAAILGFGDLRWGNILITRVYFVEGLGHNLFSVGQFCDSDLEVAFRRNACFVRNLEGVDLLKGDHSTNLYTINLHEMASASPISLMAHASSTKSWLWHQRLSHLNFNTIKDLARSRSGPKPEVEAVFI